MERRAPMVYDETQIIDDVWWQIDKWNLLGIHNDGSVTGGGAKNKKVAYRFAVDNLSSISLLSLA